MGLMQSKTDQDIHKILNHLSKLFSPCEVQMHYSDAHMAYKLIFTATAKPGITQFAELLIDETELARTFDVVQYVSEAGAKAGLSFVDHLPYSLFGKYPLIRLWHDNHLNGTQPLFGNPEVNVPGWVFGRYKNHSGWPEAGTTPNISTVSANDANYDPNDYTDRLSNAVFDVKLRKQRKELIDVATSTRTVSRKKKVSRTPPLDISKVKKPKCRDHGAEMEFSHVRGKWVCSYDGCKIVATPTRAEDDRSVTIGKGDVTLRVIATDDGKTTVLLISDDNIALNITDLVAVDDFVHHDGLLDSARDAVAANRDEYVEASPKYLGLTTRVAVVGAESLIEQHGK